MTSEEMQAKIEKHGHSIEILVEFAADNEIKISKLGEKVDSLANSMLALGESVRLVIVAVGKTQGQLDRLIKTVDRFIQGQSPNGGKP
jgi:hypothetical protein